METLLGTLVIAIPVLLVGYLLLWRSYRPVFWMMTGALAVGLGYLGFVGASDELGKPIAEVINEYSSKTSATKTSTESEMPAASTEPAKMPMSPSDGRYVTQ